MSEPRVHPDIPAKDATSVTHFICPQSPTRDGVPDATHHLRPRTTGRRTSTGEAQREEVCEYCGQTQAQLRAILPLAIR